MEKSQHKTGRAVDVPINRRIPAQRADGQALLNWLFEAGAERLRRLGVVEIIWAARIWTTAHDRGRLTAAVVTYAARRRGRLVITIRARRARGLVKLRGHRVARARKGLNRYVFDGRLRGRPLKPGRYRIVLRVRTANGRHLTVGASSITILR